MSTLPPLVHALALWNFLVGLFSIRSALAYRKYARRAAQARSADAPAATPGVTLVVPCCGDEPGLESNLEALFSQDYGDVSFRLVVEASGDGAVPTIERVLARHPGRASLVFAG